MRAQTKIRPLSIDYIQAVLWEKVCTFVESMQQFDFSQNKAHMCDTFTGLTLPLAIVAICY